MLDATIGYISHGTNRHCNIGSINVPMLVDLLVEAIDEVREGGLIYNTGV